MNAAVLLSGCGVFDGSEIHEATILLLVLKQMGFKVDFFSLDRNIEESISHMTHEKLPEKRNMMEMSSRIARGKISPMKKLKANDYNLLGMPGGFGVASNFSDFSKKGSDCTVDPEVARVIRDFHQSKKMIVAMCISPMIVAKVLEGEEIQMTVGDQLDDLKVLSSMGVDAVSCMANESCYDENHRIYTVPAYMAHKGDPKTIYESLQKLYEVINGTAR